MVVYCGDGASIYVQKMTSLLILDDYDIEARNLKRTLSRSIPNDERRRKTQVRFPNITNDCHPIAYIYIYIV